jgi:integrase/recombinase XerD
MCMIGGKCADFRAKTVELSGHLPTGHGGARDTKRAGQAAQTAAFLRSRQNLLAASLWIGMGSRVLAALPSARAAARGGAGQLTVFGKGGKTRHVLLPIGTYQELAGLSQGADDDAPVFKSRGGGRARAGGPLDPSQVFHIVEAAARRAGVALYTESVIQGGHQVQRKRSRVSPHWLRHAHASHALDNGVSMAIVKETLGHESIETTAGYTHVRPGVSSAQYLKV